MRFQALSRLRQWRYFVRDYIVKKPYKVIQYDREFGPELLSTVPFAYWHYCNGTLKKTISAKGTSPFYFFSPNHEEEFSERKFDDPIVDIPNSENHVFKYNLSKWKRVPFKNKFKNEIFVFDKPILIISNKYNQEWDGEPINFLDIDVLKSIFEKLRHKYQIIYNRPSARVIAMDNSDIKDLGDYELIKNQFPETIIMNDLHKKYSQYSFNELQLNVYANADQFISVQGGNSVLCSYFGGINLVFAKKGLELFFKEFENIYPLMADTEVINVDSYKKLMDKVDELL